MGMTRICDICGAVSMEKVYQFSPPSVIIDNDGTGFIMKDSSMTDACVDCATLRPSEVVALLIKKAEGTQE